MPSMIRSSAAIAPVIVTAWTATTKRSEGWTYKEILKGAGMHEERGWLRRTAAGEVENLEGD